MMNLGKEARKTLSETLTATASVHTKKRSNFRTQQLNKKVSLSSQLVVRSNLVAHIRQTYVSVNRVD